MDPLTVRTLLPDDVPAVAGLLAARQSRLREVRPELPESFTTAEACRPVIDELQAIAGAHGVVALDEAGRMVGYLTGFHRTEEIWGRACWSPAEGQALAASVDPERIRDLYAVWAEHFVDRGIFRHYVHVPADDSELQAAWFRTGFGVMQAHASRELTSAAPGPTDGGFTIRRAGPEDADMLDEIFPIIPAALMRSPAYAISPPERFENVRQDYEGDLGAPVARYWLAEEDGRALGLVGFWEPEPSPMIPDGATEMAVAMTLPLERGRGVMRALVETAWADARSRGIRWVVTDWRTAALPTHRSWTALGYRPLFLRLHRHIDERIAWARLKQEPATD
jgi:GNAT superfamily N-acetyltransferase